MERTIVRFACLGLVLFMMACSRQDTTPYDWQLPEHVPLPDLPQDVTMTQATVSLGRHLFYDVNLSANKTMACASCHQQGLGFAEAKSRSVGAEGEELARNALALINVAYNSTLTWANSQITTPEQQILLPLFNEHPVEMGVTGNEEEILERFTIAKYQTLFGKAYGVSAPSWEHIVNALSSFVRSLTSFQSPFDRYAYFNDDNALSDNALEGLNLFFSERLECFHCHGGINFTQSSKHAFQTLDIRPFHNTGLFDDSGDSGLYEITRDPKDKGAFRAPTLRNIAVTAPYMHDGSLNSLDAVIDFYAAGGRGAGIHDPRKSPFVSGFNLTEEEKLALIAFLHSLTDDNFLTNPSHSAPFAVPE